MLWKQENLNLNTSNVSIKQEYDSQEDKIYDNLNTSNVSIKHIFDVAETGKS